MRRTQHWHPSCLVLSRPGVIPLVPAHQRTNNAATILSYLRARIIVFHVEMAWLMLVPKNDEAPLHPSTLSVRFSAFNLVVDPHLFTDL